MLNKGNIPKFKFNLKCDEFNSFSLLIYALKIILTSFLMILVMKFTFYILNIFEFDKITILLSLISFGLLSYFLTTYILRYIPQELLTSKVFNLGK